MKKVKLELPKINLKEIAHSSNVLTGGHRLCAGCGAGITARQVTLAAQALNEPFMIVNATGCLEVATTIYPYTAWKAPWLHNAFENAAVTASGALAALEAMKKKGQIKDEHVNMIVFGGDGGTYDIGIQSLSGAIERGHDFMYVCYNNGAYMNTGIQRSSGTPQFAATTTSPAGKVIHGKIQWSKPLAEIMAAHDIPVFTASPRYYKDLMQKAQAGLKHEGPSFMLVDSPCNLGQRYSPDISLKVTELAVKSCMFPLYYTYKDEWILTSESKKIARNPAKKVPVEEYLKLQGRYKHLFKPGMEELREKIQAEVDERWERLLAKASY